MRKAFSILAIFFTAAVAAWLSGCGSAMTALNQGTGGSNQTQTPASAVPVSLTITDDPPAGISVLFFQVSLTAASLQPASGSAVSLLRNGTPIQIDVTQLQALSAFLSAANVPAGSYSSLSLTFASPQLVIFNNSDQSIAGTCAVGSVCQLTPAIVNSATVDLSSSPFPVTVAANSPLGFLIDFHLNTIIQSDLSVDLGAANGVSVAQLQPPSAPTGPPQFGVLTGTVGAVSSSLGQFTLQTPDGRSFTVSTSTSTAYDDFPASACSAAGFSCIAQGDIVQVQVSSVQSSGVLVAAQIAFVQAPGQQTVVGTIVGIPRLPLPVGETMIQLILHQNPTASTGLPLGAMAMVAVWAPVQGASGITPTAFSIDAAGFTIPSGLTFASPSDLSVGQTLQVTIAPGSLQPPTPGPPGGSGGWGPPPEPIFTASSLQLEPSQITGSISAIDAGASSFTLNYVFEPVPVIPLGQLIQYDVQTTAQTAYQGFSTDSFSGLAVNDMVSVNGWLFSPSGSTTLPVIVPKNIVLRTTGI
jgi:hypothetical protein